VNTRDPPSSSPSENSDQSMKITDPSKD
jgi:hypothetical protein